MIKRTKQIICGLLLSLILGLGLLPETAHAQEHTHCVCGGVHQPIGDHTQEEVITWTAVEPAEGETTISKAQLEAVTQAADGYYYLTADVELKDDETYKPCDPNGVGSKSVTLCLNGHSISQTKGRQQDETIAADVITGTSGQTLTLTDCQETQGTIRHTAAVNDVYGKGIHWTYDGATETGKLVLYGGSITNNIVGVYVEDSAVPVVMYGGSVTGNGHGAGSGMNLEGDFTMYGGSITGNKTMGVLGVNISGVRDYYIGGDAVISGNTNEEGNAENFVIYHDGEELCGRLNILDGFSGTVSVSVSSVDIGKQPVRYPADYTGTGTVEADSELYTIDQNGKVKVNCPHEQKNIRVNGEDIYCETCGTRMTVEVYTEGATEEDITIEYYAELSAALDHVGFGSQVSLLDDAVMESDAKIQYPLELYLYGHTLSMKPQAEGEAGQGTEATSKTLTIDVESDKTVSIEGGQDGRIDGSIALKNGKLTVACASVDTVAVSGGEFTTDGDSPVETLTVSDGEVDLDGETETVTVSGGEVELNDIRPQTLTVTGGKVGMNDGGAGTVAVSGGEVGLNGSAGTMTVTGGKVTMNHGSIGELTVSDGEMIMAGGDVHTFAVTGGSAVMTGGSIANNDGEPVLTVSGGSFSMSGGYVQQLTQSGTGAVLLSEGESGDCYLNGITTEKTIAELLSTGVAVRRGSGGWLTAEELQVKSLEDDNFFIQDAPLQNLTLTAADGSAVPGSIEYAAALTLKASAQDAEGRPVTDGITYEWAADEEIPEDDAEYVFSGAEEFNRRDVKVKQGATAAEDAEQPYRVTCYLSVDTGSYGVYTAVVSKEITVTQRSLKDAEISINGEAAYTLPYSSDGCTLPTAASSLRVRLPLADGISADLTAGSDFEPDSSSALSGTAVGSYTLRLKAVRGGNYKGETETTWKIVPKEIAADNVNVLVEGSSFTYTGSAVTPKVTVSVTDGGKTVQLSSEEYKVGYRDNISTGTATVQVVNQECGRYVFSASAVFSIQEAETSEGGASGNGGAQGSGGAQEDGNDTGQEGAASDFEWSEVADILQNPSGTESGFGAVRSAGGNVNVHAAGNGIVPSYILQKLQRTGLTLALQQGNGVALSISGSLLNQRNLSGILSLDLTLEADTDVIPAAIIGRLEAEVYHQLTIKDTGRFTVPVNLHVSMGVENAGRYANFYRYNEAQGRLEYCGSFRITENGQAMMALQQGGSYLVTMTDVLPAAKGIFGGSGYTVRSGDTLSRIAAGYRMSLAELLRKNPGILNPDRIRVGQRLNVD